MLDAGTEFGFVAVFRAFELAVVVLAHTLVDELARLRGALDSISSFWLAEALSP